MARLPQTSRTTLTNCRNELPSLPHTVLDFRNIRIFSQHRQDFSMPSQNSMLLWWSSVRRRSQSYKRKVSAIVRRQYLGMISDLMAFVQASSDSRNLCGNHSSQTSEILKRASVSQRMKFEKNYSWHLSRRHTISVAC